MKTNDSQMFEAKKNKKFEQIKRKIGRINFIKSIKNEIYINP